MELFCQVCNAPIPIGTRHVSVGHQVEQTDDGFAFDVHEAFAVAVWCLSCAPSHEAVSEAMRALVRVKQEGGLK